MFNFLLHSNSCLTVYHCDLVLTLLLFQPYWEAMFFLKKSSRNFKMRKTIMRFDVCVYSLGTPSIQNNKHICQPLSSVPPMLHLFTPQEATDLPVARAYSALLESCMNTVR